jgi:hypothetical protein
LSVLHPAASSCGRRAVASAERTLRAFCRRLDTAHALVTRPPLAARASEITDVLHCQGSQLKLCCGAHITLTDT